MITGAQIRSARNALRWTTEELAKRSGVTARTIKRFEAVDGVPPSRSSTLLDVKAALEVAGVKFIGAPADRPGIRLAGSPASATSRKRRPRDDSLTLILRRRIHRRERRRTLRLRRAIESGMISSQSFLMTTLMEASVDIQHRHSYPGGPRNIILFEYDFGRTKPNSGMFSMTSGRN